MRLSRSATALVVLTSLVASLTGCFGYNRSAKRWAYESSIHGQLLAGVVLVAAGLTGLVINATRDTVKTSR